VKEICDKLNIELAFKAGKNMFDRNGYLEESK